MKKSAALAIATSLAVVSFTSAANSISVPTSDIPDNPNPGLELTRVQLTIQNPDGETCPTTRVVKAEIYTNAAGPVEFYLVRKGGSFDGPFSVETKLVQGGAYLASFSREIRISSSVEFLYKITATANNSSAQSKWVPLITRCN